MLLSWSLAQVVVVVELQRLGGFGPEGPQAVAAGWAFLLGATMGMQSTFQCVSPLSLGGSE